MDVGEPIDLSSGQCPDCAGTLFHPGPRGGAAINVKCAKCSACFNYSGPLPAQRIDYVDGVYSEAALPLERLEVGLSFVMTIMHIQADRDRYRRIAREIVAMLIKRKRSLRRRVRRLPSNVPESTLLGLLAEDNEAHNAAEIARRILYGLPR
jgi:hypothetical protein